MAPLSRTGLGPGPFRKFGAVSASGVMGCRKVLQYSLRCRTEDDQRRQLCESTPALSASLRRDHVTFYCHHASRLQRQRGSAEISSISKCRHMVVEQGYTGAPGFLQDLEDGISSISRSSCNSGFDIEVLASGRRRFCRN